MGGRFVDGWAKGPAFLRGDSPAASRWPRIATLAAALALPLTLFAAGLAAAMEFQPYDTFGGKVVIRATGAIMDKDSERLQAAVAKVEASGKQVIALVVTSNGGMIAEGGRIGQIVRDRKWAVGVVPGGICASACFLFFAAAPVRVVAPDARVGVHGASEKDGKDSGTAQNSTIVMARYLAALGVHPAIIGKMALTKPDDITWLDADDLKAMGVTSSAAPPASLGSLTNGSIVGAQTVHLGPDGKPLPGPDARPLTAEQRIAAFVAASADPADDAAFGPLSNLTPEDRKTIEAGADPIAKERVCLADFYLAARVQQTLNLCGSPGLIVDGSWGAGSRRAAADFATHYKKWLPNRDFDANTPTKAGLDAVNEVRSWWMGPCTGAYSPRTVALPATTPPACAALRPAAAAVEKLMPPSERLAVGKAAAEKPAAEKAPPQRATTAKTDTQKLDALLERGRILTSDRDWPGAIMVYGEAIAVQPDNPFLYTARGEVLSNNGEHTAAIVDFDRALRLEPHSAVTLALRGRAGLRSGDLRGGLADLDKALALDPKFGFAYAHRGIARQNLDDPDGALVDYNKAIAIDPKDAATVNNRGLIYRDRGDEGLALADFSLAVTLDPKEPTYLFNRAIQHRGRGDLSAAIADMDAGLESGQSTVFRLLHHASALMETGKFVEAESDVRRAYALSPKDVLMAVWIDLATARMGLPRQQITLALRRSLKGAWPSPILGMFLGQMTPADVVAAAGDPRLQAQRVCAAAYFAGEYELLRAEKAEAAGWLRRAAFTCARGTVEAEAARGALRALGEAL